MIKISPKLKIFIFFLILGLFFVWGLNIWQENSKKSQLLTFQLAQQYFEEELEDLKPLRNWQVKELNIVAKSVISVLIDNQGREKVLFNQNSDEKLPIASLTKLMSAAIVLENYDLNQVIKISKEFENLKIGQLFRVKDLLYLLLMESNNESAIVLVEVIGENAFVDLMNLKAKELNLENTFFVNSTGLDFENSEDYLNYSTTKDLVKLTNHLLKTKSLIWEISLLPEFDLYLPNEVYYGKVKNTNELLGEIPFVLGGKTGKTLKANGCFLLILRAPKDKGYLINVILGTNDRFGEMKKLINWLKLAYKW